MSKSKKYIYEKVARGLNKILNTKGKYPYFAFCHISEEHAAKIITLSEHTGFTPDRIIAFAVNSHVETELAKLGAGEAIITKDTVPPKEDQSAQ